MNCSSLLPENNNLRNYSAVNRHFRLHPRPESDVEYLHGILESIAQIEVKKLHLISKLLFLGMFYISANELTYIINWYLCQFRQRGTTY